MAEVTLVRGEGGDWEGLYVDGQLAVQGHSLEPCDVLLALGQEYHGLRVEQRWLETELGLPANLGDIPQEVRDGR